MSTICLPSEVCQIHQPRSGNLPLKIPSTRDGTSRAPDAVKETASPMANDFKARNINDGYLALHSEEEIRPFQPDDSKAVSATNTKQAPMMNGDTPHKPLLLNDCRGMSATNTKQAPMMNGDIPHNTEASKPLLQNGCREIRFTTIIEAPVMNDKMPHNHKASQPSPKYDYKTPRAEDEDHFFLNSAYAGSDERDTEEPRSKQSDAKRKPQVERGYKIRSALFGVLDVVWTVVLVYLSYTLLAAPACESTVKPVEETVSASEEPLCFPCKSLPPHLRQSQQVWCCAGDAVQLQLFVDSFANTKMSETHQKKVTVSKMALNAHVKIDSSKIRGTKKPGDGYLPLTPSSDSTNPHIACDGSCLRVRKDGAYFVYAHMMFNLTSDKCRDMTFSVLYEDSETETIIHLFESYIPSCSCDSSDSRAVPGFVGGIKTLKKGDKVYVKTSHPELLSFQNNQFGFHAL